MTRLLYRGLEFWRLAVCRLRAHAATALGVRTDGKCLFGRGVRIGRPWTVRMGTRCVLEDHVWLNVVSDEASVEIGDYAFIGRGTELGVVERVRIGAHVLIGPGVFITDHQHNIEAGSTIGSQGCSAKPVDVAGDVWLGAGAIVLPGVQIGRGAVVGAGAVVTHDVPANAVVAGVPAKLIRERSSSKEVEKSR